MRFSESGCRHCVDSCPHGAVTLDGGLSIDPQRCRGCLLCTAVCPVGALEQNSDFSIFLSQLSRVPEPVLGCTRTRECANAAIACLGGLSEEHLLALCHAVAGRLTLNLSICNDCPNVAAVHPLRQRLAALSAAKMQEGGCQFVIVESTPEIHFRDESVDRRGFFKSFRNSLIKSATVILSSTSASSELRREYALKRLPVRRELLNRTVERLPAEMGILVRDRYDHQITISGSCTACQGCVAICPSGALFTDSLGEQPQFERQRCTGCRLCVEFCLDGAVKLVSPEPRNPTRPE
jgi:formate hydrogenlyase subunit 6/NADH:ubiquinone oxidoreductase subunit I